MCSWNYCDTFAVNGYVQNAPEFVGTESTYQGCATMMPFPMIIRSSWLSITPSLATTSVLLSLSCLVHRMHSFTRHHPNEMVPMCVVHWPSVGLLAMLQGVDGYTQSQPKLVGTGYGGTSYQGPGTAVSGDGFTACVGGYDDNGSLGAVWFYTRAFVDSFTWTEQGSKIAPNDGTRPDVFFGIGCSLNFNGNIAAVGGYGDNNFIGATWIITRNSSGVWAQQGVKQVGTGYITSSTCGAGNCVSQGGPISIASIADNVYVTGGPSDNSNEGMVLLVIVVDLFIV